jgi:hypothetical protein
METCPVCLSSISSIDLATHVELCFEAQITTTTKTQPTTTPTPTKPQPTTTISSPPVKKSEPPIKKNEPATFIMKDITKYNNPVSFEETMKYLFDPGLAGLSGKYKRLNNSQIEVEVELPLKAIVPTLLNMKAMKWGNIGSTQFSIIINLMNEFYMEYPVPPRISLKTSNGSGEALKWVVETKLQEFLQGLWEKRIQTFEKEKSNEEKKAC